MKIVFFASEKPREQLLAEAFAKGCAAHGDKCEVRVNEMNSVGAGYQVAAMVGVKSREIWQAHWRAGIHTVMLDKGYSRHKIGGPVRVWEYWRVAVDGHHPTRYLMARERRHDRVKRLDLAIEPWTRTGRHIVFAGSSAKYHGFYGLPGPTEYAAAVFAKLRRLTDRDIIYRPKPSWRDAVPLPHTRFSCGNQESLDDVLVRAHCLVTHGSNACFEAVLAGVPCIILGDGVAREISSTYLSEIEKPFRCAENVRAQWLANLAYCQWTMPEFEDGAAWSEIRPVIYGG